MHSNNNEISSRELFKTQTGMEFSDAYEKYYTRLIYYINKFTNGDTQSSEDIVSETFIIAFDKIFMYDKTKSQFSTWLYTIARNLSLQEVKKNKKNQHISIDFEYDDSSSTMKDFLTDSYIEEDKDSRRLSYLKAKVVREHIKDLKEPFKSVIVMREIKKMSYKDIADELDRNLSTVKSQIRNGRKLLMKKSNAEIKTIEKLF